MLPVGWALRAIRRGDREWILRADGAAGIRGVAWMSSALPRRALAREAPLRPSLLLGSRRPGRPRRRRRCVLLRRRVSATRSTGRTARSMPGAEVHSGKSSAVPPRDTAGLLEYPVPMLLLVGVLGGFDVDASTLGCWAEGQAADGASLDGHGIAAVPTFLLVLLCLARPADQHHRVKQAEADQTRQSEQRANHADAHTSRTVGPHHL